jgi:hypothetical protein
MTGKNRIYLILISILILSINSYALVQLTSTDTVDGYIIDYPKIETIKFNESHEFNFHVFSQATGLPITNFTAADVECIFHLYLLNGTHVCNMDNLPYITADNRLDFTASLNADNFTELGNHFYRLLCNNSKSMLGGAVSQSFDVTLTGNKNPSDILGIFLILGILGIISLFIYMAINLDDKFYYIKFLFLLLVLILFSIAFYVIREITMANYPTTLGEIFNIVFWVYLYIMLFLFLIIFIMFIVGLFKKEKDEDNIYE